MEQSLITNGVRVHVDNYYQQDYSNPMASEFMFAYRITIENINPFTVQLLTRHWYIFDSDGNYREVEGEGVVGAQPEIQPGSEYGYVSGCNLHTEIGRMHGQYIFKNLKTGARFPVTIPPFYMVTPFKYN